MKSTAYKIDLPAFFTGILFVMFIWAASFAQSTDTLSSDEVSDQDLQTFLNINMRMLKLQEQAMQQVEQYIQEQGMTPQRYGEIAAEENNPQTQSDATEEELETAEKISEHVQQVNMELEQQAETIVQEEGLTMQQYQTLGSTIEQSPDLQQKLNEMMQKEIQ
ncbi:MAG: DUF4168 domain-containing protein [Chitinivibrionales bacterium]